MSHFLLAMDLLEEKRLPNVQSFHQFAPTNFETILSRQKPFSGPKRDCWGICFGIALGARFRPFEKKKRLKNSPNIRMQRFCICPHKTKTSRYRHRWYKSDTGWLLVRFDSEPMSCWVFTSGWKGRWPSGFYWCLVCHLDVSEKSVKHWETYSFLHKILRSLWTALTFPPKEQVCLVFLSRCAKRQVLFQPINQPKSPNPPNLHPTLNPQPSHQGPSMPNRRQQSSHRKWDHPRSQLLRLSQTSLVETTTSLVETNPDVFFGTTADSLDDFGADFFSVFGKKTTLLFFQSHFC